MKRAITSTLLSWKTHHNRKPLIIRGARQVGKSWSVNEFGREYVKGHLHVVNLEKRPDWHVIFEQNLDAKRILSELEIVLNTQIEAGKDLLFFDEIQACPRAISSLRYFYEQIPALHVIAAGSLLEFALEDISFPVGRVQMLNMYPMSFVEYLWAMGKERLAELVLAEPVAHPPHIHDLLQEELKRYFFVGGMPECVKTFAETEKLLAVQQVQTDLIDTYRQDFSKYAPYSDKRCLNDVLASVASKVGQQIKYTGLSQDFSGLTNKKAFHLLSTARLIHKVRATSPAGLPLAAAASEKKFKATMLDIGLLTRLSGLSLSAAYSQKQLLSIFKGALAEQFVGQELLAHGQEELFYWAREAKSSSAEVDYLVAKDGAVIPVEVKNSASGRLKSLHALLDRYPVIPQAIIFSDARFGDIPEQKLRFLPLYYISSFFHTPHPFQS